MDAFLSQRSERVASKGREKAERLPLQLAAILAAVLIAALALKMILVAAGRLPFNADEAVVALMARHILAGERPVFFYGQAYMGSLEAFLVASGFWLIGQHTWVIRLLQGVLYLGTIISTTWLGKSVFGSWEIGIGAAILLAVPTVNVMLYTTVSLGGYGEAILIGNLILLSGLRIGKLIGENASPPQFALWLIFGILVGSGVWAFGLTLVYSLPAGVFLAWKIWRAARGKALRFREVTLSFCCAGIGFLVGAIPLFVYGLRNGFSQLWMELGGKAIAGVEGVGFLGQIGQHLVNLVLLGSTVIFGFRPPWGVSWLVLPLIPFVLMVWVGLFVFTFRRFRHGGSLIGEEKLLIAGVAICLLAGFVLTPFGADPSGRYFLPLAAPMSLFAAWGFLSLPVKRRFYIYGIFALLLGFNFLSILQAASQYPPGLTTQFYEPTRIDHRYDSELIQFLTEKGETLGYSNYWVAYPLAFLSQEKLIFVPRLPYHQDFRYTSRDDRYAAYDQMVGSANHAAYITTRHEALDERLRNAFTSIGVTWLEKQIGDYRIFYHLSRKVEPGEIGF